MLMLVDRFTSNNHSTISIVCVDGMFTCFGLEDEYRAHKIPGVTRIPAGRYKVGLREEGGFHARYEKKFPEIHKGMLQVLDVPGFEYILIHVGNTHGDTAGCLLVGAGANTLNEMAVQSSTIAYADLYSRVIDAAKLGELEIEYVDNDLAEVA